MSSLATLLRRGHSRSTRNATRSTARQGHAASQQFGSGTTLPRASEAGSGRSQPFTLGIAGEAAIPTAHSPREEGIEIARIMRDYRRQDVRGNHTNSWLEV